MWQFEFIVFHLMSYFIANRSLESAWAVTYQARCEDIGHCQRLWEQKDSTNKSADLGQCYSSLYCTCLKQDK